jgi:hypothetical protein
MGPRLVNGRTPQLSGLLFPSSSNGACTGGFPVGFHVAASGLSVLYLREESPELASLFGLLGRS